MKLHDAELRLMEIVWQGNMTAKEIALRAAETIGWNKNTTYTVLKKLVDKGAILRKEPNFVCVPLIERKDVGREQTDSLIDRLYGGSKKAFFAALIEDEGLSADELDQLKELLNR
ncbi:MAG: BlaI/MecI/CopY family transcriptional regulator [Eubacteriales bacterium]|nr:BlaI/MecI/CopY family transcriptional regulator [Eubacteriales bacterium]